MSAVDTEKKTILPEEAEELQRFDENIKALQTGKMDPNDFKKFRLNNGVYGIRGESDRHMIRIKVPGGDMNADQLDAVAEVTEKYTRLKLAHVTTRQAIQIHHVHVNSLPELLRTLNESGLTSREACGNTVRNVTATPFAGLLPDEAFDVSKYVDVMFKMFLRNPACQNFPRKFKIAFYGGGKEDIAYTAINDLGFVAAKRVVNGKEEKGFRVYMAGGLGATPHLAILLEEFTPMEDVFPTAMAAARVFDRHGDRKDKFHARLKFVLKKFGDDAFRRMMIEERTVVKSTRAGGWKWNIPEDDDTPLPDFQPTGVDASVKPDVGFELWRQTNVIAQKQAGYSLAIVVTPLGDINVEQMRKLANMARKYNGGRVRTMIQQNFMLPWIKNEHLVPLYNQLKAANLHEAGALRLVDVTRCPGADTCQIAITKSRGLAGAILNEFKTVMKEEADMKDLSIKISGCTNSCGQHHIGNIGFFGTYRKIDGREVPHYQLLVGGDIREGFAKFGSPIASIPARRAPEVVKALVGMYKAERTESERFVETMNRLGKERLKAAVEPFKTLPPFDENPEMYFEWGEHETFKASIGQGECAA